MKTFLVFLAIGSMAFAQMPVSSPATSLTKEEILARAMAKITAQRAQQSASALAEKASRDSVKKKKADYEAELASCWQLRGRVKASQQEGLRIHFWKGNELMSCMLVGYPKPVNYEQEVNIMVKPDGNCTYPGASGFQVTMPKVRYFGPPTKFEDNEGKMRDGVSHMKD